MDILPNRHDALILRLANLSPLARHILDGEAYRLRLETDDVESDSVLQECILALRDDLAAIGLYFTCPLGDVYADLGTLNQVLDVFEYILPNAFYTTLRSDTAIRPMLVDLLNGGVGDDATILLYLRWLGSGPECYVPRCAPGAHWLAGRIESTALFDLYLKHLIEVETTLDHPIPLAPEDLQAYMVKIHEHAARIDHGLDLVQFVPEVEAQYEMIRRRFDLYIRHLLQPAYAAEHAWLWMTDPETLSPDLQATYQLRWRDVRKTGKLYAEYYLSKNPPEYTLIAVIGVALRSYADDPTRPRDLYLKSLTKDLNVELTFTIPLRALLMRIVTALYPVTPKA